MAKRGNNKGATEGAAERRIKALELRKAGASYRAIGEKLGISDVQAMRDVQAALKVLRKQQDAEAKQVLALELERLDIALLAIASQVRAGHLGAIDRWLRLSERRSKLLGLDAPIQSTGDLTIKIIRDEEPTE